VSHTRPDKGVAGAVARTVSAAAVMGQGVGDRSWGVFGWGTGSDGIGVHGAATDGVGGIFEGSKANITLRPIPGQTPPRPGHDGRPARRFHRQAVVLPGRRKPGHLGQTRLTRPETRNS